MKLVCGALMVRADKPCRLMAGHKGCHRHDSVWYCDACGKPQSGTVAAHGPEGLCFCWICTNLSAKENYDGL